MQRLPGIQQSCCQKRQSERASGSAIYSEQSRAKFGRLECHRYSSAAEPDAKHDRGYCLSKLWNNYHPPLEER